ncbi:alpha/beta fold hydrolase [Aquibacillus koreensis]|uniref:Alpha/beta fold hydrolase n=1 Tax=Aquibacillus koreensis TaxID=279446 RepID=A0A9X3WLF7_9BACI|nr:alpha/beta fold hydrolase [Aquibacillus koreensis]MCT2535144.1 alpha/beta fold hydrolase [Aquibacillus koreensis]MDC3421003.1 alpha/beta fold hydrolase [Aquibacillus koreensis]
MEVKTISVFPKMKFIEVIIQVILSPILMIMGFIVAWKLSHPKRSKVKGSPRTYGLAYKDVEFKSADNKTSLKGWLIEAEKPIGTIIFSHGYRGSRTRSPIQSLKLAAYYVKKGYNILTFDYRNCGESEGKKSTIGLFETKDLIGAIRYTKQKVDYKKLILMGWSTGGSCSIMAAAQEEADAIIVDSAFDDLESYLNNNLSNWTNLPKLVNPFILFFFPFLSFGNHPRMVNPSKSLDDVNCPVYFIHNQDDDKVPHTCSVRMYHNYKGRKRLWITNKGGHVKNHLSNKEYLSNIDRFLESVR